MSQVSVRDLRNDGGSVIERVLHGELVTITKAGHPVAELRPLGRAPLTAAQLVRRWKNMPRIDGEGLRRDLDELLDASL
jgi:prevent-host-death family protein